MSRRRRRGTPLSELPVNYFDERYPQVRHDLDPAYHDPPDREQTRRVDPKVYDEDGGPF